MPKLQQLKYQPFIFDDEWQPEPKYRNPKDPAGEIMQQWVDRTRDATGEMPKGFNAYATRRQISLKIKKHGYLTVLKVIIYLTSTFCKYYQYPFSWNKHFDKVLADFEKDKANPEGIREYDGFIGPIGLKELDSTPKEKHYLTIEEINELLPL